jgi:hypothetical protein
VIAEKFEDWFWQNEDGFQFRAERFFQWAKAKADTDIGFNEYLSDWMKSAFEAGYKEGYRDALASLHYKPDNGSGNAAVMHLQ